MVTIIDAVLGDDASRAEGYIRVASMAFAFYDYIITLPIEYRVYRSQRSFFRMSLACILFILIRYTSILVMVTSNYGFFATSFTEESCRRFYFVPPIFKDLQASVSQAILGVRTFNIAGRNKQLGLFLLVYFCITVALEWFFDLYRRTSQVVGGNCVSGVSGAHPLTWVFYLVAMIYDLMALVLSTIHLVRYKTYSGKFSFLVRVMMYDGLIFFVVLTAVNILNLILYRQLDLTTQSTGVSLGYAVVWIMSQRILIHLRELVGERSTSGVSRISNVVVHPGRSFVVGSQHHQRTPPTPLRATHSSGLSPLDQKGLTLHDISNIDDVDYSRPPSSPAHFQHHHPFSSSNDVVAPDDRGYCHVTAGRDQTKAAGLDVPIRFQRTVIVDPHHSSNDTEDAEGASEMHLPSHAISRDNALPMWS